MSQNLKTITPLMELHIFKSEHKIKQVWAVKQALLALKGQALSAKLIKDYIDRFI